MDSFGCFKPGAFSLVLLHELNDNGRTMRFLATSRCTKPFSSGDADLLWRVLPSDGLQPPRHSRLDNRPVRQENDKIRSLNWVIDRESE